jgi:hypothetical protein
VLDFKMNAVVHATGLLALAGNYPIPFTVSGTCAQPVFRPALETAAQVEVKGLENGIGKAAGDQLKNLFADKPKPWPAPLSGASGSHPKEDSPPRAHFDATIGRTLLQRNSTSL